MAISRRVRKIRRTLRRKRVQRGGDYSLWHIYIHARNGATHYREQPWDDDDIEGLEEMYTDMAIDFGYFKPNEQLNYQVDHNNKHLIIQRQQDLNNPYANNNNNNYNYNNNNNNGTNVAPFNPFDNGANVAPVNPFDAAHPVSVNPFDAFNAAHVGASVALVNPFNNGVSVASNSSEAAFEQSLQQTQPAAAAAAPLVNTDPENTNNSNNSDPSVNVPSGVRPANKSNDEPTNSVEGGRRRRRHSKTKKHKANKKRKATKRRR